MAEAVEGGGGVGGRPSRVGEGGKGGGVVEWSRGGWLLNNRIGFRFSPPSLSVGSARLARPVATPYTGVIYNGIFCQSFWQ